MRLDLSHLREQKFKRNFQEPSNPIYGKGIETSCHCLLHCSLYTNEILAFLNVIQDIDNSVLKVGDSLIFDVLFQVTPIY